MDVPLYFGQRMSAAVRDRGVMLERVVRANAALEEAIDAGVEVELGVSVWGAFRPGPTMRALGPCLGVADLSRSWLVGYDRLIVAAGARDLVLAFRGWEKAGTMGAAGALALLTRYQACAARRMVVLGSGPLGLAVADARARPRHRGAGHRRGGAGGARRRRDARKPSRGRGALLPGPRGRRGAGGARRDRGRFVSSRSTGASGRSRGATPRSPATRCASPSGSSRRSSCSRSWGAGSSSAPSRGGFVPETDAEHRTSLPEVFAVGDCAGVDEGVVTAPDRAIRAGRRAGLAAAAALGLGTGPGAPDAPDDRGSSRGRTTTGASGSARRTAAGGPEILACQCEEVTRGRAGRRPAPALSRAGRAPPCAPGASGRSARTGRSIPTR